MGSSLPWEVLERIIDFSGDHSNTLHGFSLTCRQLHPRSRCVLFARLNFVNRERVFAFVDFLDDNPHLKPVVRSIAVRPDDFPPFPLLYILPNLDEIRFTSRECLRITTSTAHIVPTMWHDSSLACSQRFGTNVRTLHLSCVSFATYLPFTRALLAFTNILHLTCTHVVINATGDRAPLDVFRRRLSEQMRLKSLSIDHLSLTRDTRDASVDGFLFDPTLAPSTVESLRLIREHRPDTFAHHTDWTRLRSLVLQLSSYMPEVVAKTTKLLRNIQGPALREVSLEFGPVSSVLGTIRDLQRTSRFQPSIYAELERALLRFSEPGIIWTTGGPLRADRSTFWAGELGRHFPSLSQRGAMTIKCEIVTPVGHDATLQALVASPHSKWVASGSEDSSVILWNTDGNIAQQWLTDAHESVWSLAFSPAGRYLVSGDGAGKVEIRDLSQGASKVATLEGHTSAISSCAWSPRGDTIASGSFDASVRLWDAQTFEQLHELRAPPMKGMQYVDFSPDGRWLASWAFPCHYAIWDVPAGALHKLIEPAAFGTVRMLDIAAAFDPSSTRLATVSRHEAVEIWDVQAGRRQRVLRRVGEANDIAFSPDGGMLLIASGDRTVRIWDVREWVEVRRLKGHTSIVSEARFSPCGKYVASASWDETVRVWRTGDGSCVATFADHGHLVTHVAFSPDGRTLASGGRNGTVILRHMRDIVPKDDSQDT